MIKIKNSRKHGKWLFRLGSKKRMVRVRSKKPGKWKLLFKIGRNRKRQDKLKKMRKMNKMRKMDKPRKMNRVFILPKWTLRPWKG